MEKLKHWVSSVHVNMISLAQIPFLFCVIYVAFQEGYMLTEYQSYINQNLTKVTWFTVFGNSLMPVVGSVLAMMIPALTIYAKSQGSSSGAKIDLMEKLIIFICIVGSLSIPAYIYFRLTSALEAYLEIATTMNQKHKAVFLDYERHRIMATIGVNFFLDIFTSFLSFYDVMKHNEDSKLENKKKEEKSKEEEKERKRKEEEEAKKKK